MKNFVKQILTVLFSILVFFIASAQENTNESAELIASATVQGALSITKDADVSFGNISATTDGIVRLVPNGSSSSYVGSNATTGKLTINGAGNASVLISYPAGVNLLSNESEQLAYNLHVYGHNDDVQSSALQLSEEGEAGDNVGRVLDVTTGKYYLYVGGALGGTVGLPAALSNQAAGEYTGTVIFEVKYN
ncbi:MAG: DUF4402 domain-containing protein [Mariniphaga sp.]|nr:DUF4402 domain-containing protein [Mariniphaga sp.]